MPAPVGGTVSPSRSPGIRTLNGQLKRLLLCPIELETHARGPLPPDPSLASRRGASLPMLRALGRTRTADIRFRKPAFYPLNYEGINLPPEGGRVVLLLASQEAATLLNQRGTTSSLVT